MSPSAGVRLEALKFTYPAGDSAVGRSTDRSAAGRVGGAGLAGSASPCIDIPELTFEPGKISVLIGDNGCGKTTLLKLLAGLLSPVAGRVMCRDAPVLVHQKPFIFAESVLANVMYPLRIRRVGRDEARRRGRTALQQVGLEAFSRRWAPTLSGGEKQRLAIARALVLDPEILILDEPTSNIDSPSIEVIEKVLRNDADRGRTIILTTHNIASAYRLADHIVPMASGRVRPLTVNVMRGRSHIHPDEHIGRFRTQSGLELFCPALDGAHTTAVVSMEDVLLSRSAITTSAQNRLLGDIRDLVPLEDELVRVTMACRSGSIAVSGGATDSAFELISALVTHRSVEELELVRGSSVFVTFKASAMKLY